MGADATEQGERARVVHEIRTLTAAMEQAALPAQVQHLLSMDLTIQQLKVLMVLVTTREGATGRGLAASFGVSMATMSGLIDRLASQGMATRSEDPDDHRVRRVHATSQGAALARRLVMERPEFNDSVLMGLSIEDLNALQQGIRAVSDRYASLVGGFGAASDSAPANGADATT
ncbi:MarR family winged helix-turn-helix transcriptional regulator [Nocardiopsis sp. L17-MgMaSL7]|uniref:MarR family winged helix-turn-helix transcriptional regulator n=1 Tax=Nocardiopsis sp. L17-MgMaSL7 TaxID=1938893 RepID=UPI000D71D71E|nr:MarR family transcriptional regulator [Nocardiopsis sp. L17-MgMaSL7]PWV57386.1 DNA-binding MarR family transcriptional regulator [Nocardiopsis sp. L17-MgMaSL7]